MEEVAIVGLLQAVVPHVGGHLREVELRRVPAADAVVRAEVSLDGEVVGLGLVPLGEEEHVLAVLVREPRDGHRGVQGLVLSAHKTNFTNSMATSRHTVTGGMWFGRLLVIFSTRLRSRYRSISA